MSGQSSRLNRLKKYSELDTSEIFRYFSISSDGLNSNQIESIKKKYGTNEYDNSKRKKGILNLIKLVFNPFSCVLLVLAVISFITDILLQVNSQSNYTTVIIIVSVIIVSSLIRLYQDKKAIKATESLQNYMQYEVKVKRNGEIISVLLKDLIVGDIVYLSAGDYVPADLRIIDENTLHISQSSITGESKICKKSKSTIHIENQNSISQYTNIAFMSTMVISGTGTGIVVAVGKDTIYGSAAYDKTKTHSAYEKGANSISFMLIKFMLVMVSLVFIVTMLTHNNFLYSILFSMSVAIGIMPELLPMVITACLAKGSLLLSKKHTIIKDINAMQGFGSMDILCMDKTGTITNDGILMEYYMDILGNESNEVLDCAYINSFYHSISYNVIDNAILSAETMPGKELHFKNLVQNYKKLDVNPFGYTRKYATVLVKDNNNETQIIMKGNIEDVLSHCKYVEYKGKLRPIEKDDLNSVWVVVNEMLEEGMKVIAIAKKSVSLIDKINQADKNNLALIGYIAFFDAPKPSSKQSIESLKNLSVKPKILTGDNKIATKSICKRVGISYTPSLTGEDLSKLSDKDLKVAVETTDVFTELTPEQKVDIIMALKENGHTVGFLGDGMNDIPALVESDVGISVDTAVDNAKSSADVILLQKDLNVLTDGILEGRKTFVNMLKYIKITASSNLGNIISIVVASAFLPFMPMISVQILLLNLLYDLLCIAIPFDNVHKDELKAPKIWSGKTLPKFMLCFGSISSVFDIITYLFLFFVLCPMLTGDVFSVLTDTTTKLQYISIFQTGWFLESMWTQVLILHILRTKKLAFWKDSASKPVLLITFLGIISFTAFTFTSFAKSIGFTTLPIWYYGFLLLIVIFYMIITTTLKSIYLKKHRDLI